MKKSSKRRPKVSRSRKKQAAAAPRAGAPHPVAAIAQPVPQPARSRPAKSQPRAGRAAPSSRSRRSLAAIERHPAFTSDNRRVVAMLLMPFILVAFAMAITHSQRNGVRSVDLARGPSAVLPREPVKQVVPPSVPLAPSAMQPAGLPRVTETPVDAVARRVEPKRDPLPPSVGPAAPVPETRDAALLLPNKSEALLPPVTGLALDTVSAPPPTPVVVQAPDAVPIVADIALPVSQVSPDTLVSAGRPPVIEIAALPQIPDPAHSAADPPTSAPPAGVCAVPPGGLAKSAARPAITPPSDPAAFGVALATAALAQTREFVVYNDKYRRIAYPMGDVPSFYGVCTDVLIRAFRALSIDLQSLVQQTRSGSGDPSIDHRRVDTLRRFFAAHGQSIPITEFAEDYRPGDIVSYWRPQNRHSRTHIAIVANEIGPSGRPMIIHNRGWGPQLEDGLFVDQMTGHYRFTGLRSGTAPVVAPVRGAAKSAAAQGAAARATQGAAMSMPQGARQAPTHSAARRAAPEIVVNR